MKLLDKLKEDKHYKKVMETVSESEQEGITKVMEEFLGPWEKELRALEEKIKEDPEFAKTLGQEVSKLYSQMIDITKK